MFRALFSDSISVRLLLGPTENLAATLALEKERKEASHHVANVRSRDRAEQKRNEHWAFATRYPVDLERSGWGVVFLACLSRSWGISVHSARYSDLRGPSVFGKRNKVTSVWFLVRDRVEVKPTT